MLEPLLDTTSVALLPPSQPSPANLSLAKLLPTMVPAELVEAVQAVTAAANMASVVLLMHFAGQAVNQLSELALLLLQMYQHGAAVTLQVSVLPPSLVVLLQLTA